MKKHTMAFASLALAMTTASVAKAEFSIDEIHSATKLAVEDLVRNKPEHAPHFYGYKSWKSGDEAQVKVYVKHDGMTMDFGYVCHKHDAEIECHAQ